MNSMLRRGMPTAQVGLWTLTRSAYSSRPLYCGLAYASRIAVRGPRHYSSKPKSKKGKDIQNHDKKQKQEASGEVPPDSKATTPPAEDANSPAKAAPGKLNLYSQNSPLSTSQPSNPPSDEPGPLSHPAALRDSADVDQRHLPDGWVYMNAEEERLLNDLLSVDPKKRGEDRTIVHEFIEEIKIHGIPLEMREFLATYDKASAITSMVRLHKMMTKIRKEMKRIKAADRGDERSSSSSQQTDKARSKSLPPPEQDGNNNKPPGRGPVKFDLQSFLASTFVSYFLYRLIVPGENSKEISYQEFRSTLLEKGLVEKLTVEGHSVKVDVNREATQAVYPDSPAAHGNFHYKFSIGSADSFERNLDAVQAQLEIPPSERIPVTYATASHSDIWSFLISFGPTVLLIGGIYYLTKGGKGSGGGLGGGGGIFGMGKSRAKQFNHETDVRVKFKDVAGMDEAKLEIMEFVSFLKTPEKFERLGAKIPRGAILSGPPGTGKTLLAKATAGESSVPFFSVSGSEFVEMFVGVGASRVSDLFAMARKTTPCIIFIDEIDAIGKARSKSNFGGNDEREATLNQILTEMDGFNTSEQIVVLAGTNRPDVLDQALMRPGRFDRHIAIDRPTMEGRKQIFKVHLAKIVTKEEIEHLTGRLSALTPGFSGADIANCVNEAALIAARQSVDSVAMIHFEQAIERVVGGLEKKSLVLSPEERRTVAYHEAGHAVCGWYFEHADPLLKVSIIPRGQGALGYAQYLPNSDVYLMNTNQLMDRMAMTLGGRISEELHFPVITSGGSDDFNKVTRMATAMVTKWGMSKKLGPLHFEDDENKLHKPFAEATAQMIDAEVSRIVYEAYTKCTHLLTAKKVEVGIVAEELLKKEMLDRNDMVRLLGKRPFESHKEFEKYFGGFATGEKSAPPPPPTEGHPVIGEGGSIALSRRHPEDVNLMER